MFLWNSLAFSMIQPMLAISSLVPLPFLKPAWTSGSSWFMYCWSLAWRILSTFCTTHMTCIPTLASGVHRKGKTSTGNLVRVGDGLVIWYLVQKDYRDYFPSTMCTKKNVPTVVTLLRNKCMACQYELSYLSHLSWDIFSHSYPC